MPRIRRGLEEEPRPRFPTLVAELVDELRNGRDSGQPVIEEQLFPKTKALRVTVFWDRWEGITDEDRAATILQAYEQAEGKETRDRIALAIGLTIPEGKDSGLLPYQITPALRRGDAVSLQQCAEAMIAEGASVLAREDRPELRFATTAEAEACVIRLVTRLPGSEPIWVISQEVARVG
jgi:hypothetical protein